MQGGYIYIFIFLCVFLQVLPQRPKQGSRTHQNPSPYPSRGPLANSKKKGVVVTAHWVRRGAYVCPKKDAGVGYVGVHIWAHDKIL